MTSVFQLRWLLFIVALSAAWPLFGLGQPLATKLAVPDDAADAKATATIREVYADEYRKAKTAADRAALAAKMLQQAGQVQNDPVGRYVLLRVARDVAGQAGNLALALRVVEEMERDYQVDGTAMKGKILLDAATARPAGSQKLPVGLALSVIREMLISDDYESVNRLLRALQGTAQKNRNMVLAKRLTALGKQIQQMEKAHVEVLPALAALRKGATSPDANCAAGLFACLWKNDWETGLPMLAKGSNAAMAAMAKKELVTPTAGEAQAVGDAWWDLAASRPERESELLRLHAGDWYFRAEPQLAKGLARVKADKRLRDLAAVNPPLTEQLTLQSMLQSAALLMPFEPDTILHRGDKTFIRDLSGSDSHGQVFGATLATDGRAGAALKFSGKNQFVLLPTLRAQLVQFGRGFSISAWVQTGVEKEHSFIFDCGHWADHSLHLDTAGRSFVFGLPTGRGGVILQADTEQFADWHHLAGVWDGIQQRLYVDGLLKAGGATQNFVLQEDSLATIPAKIGSQGKDADSGDRYFQGLIDELAVFRRALTEPEIGALYRAGRRGYVLRR